MISLNVKTGYQFLRLNSQEFLREAMRLRFQVYCRECHFIKEEEYREGYETDEFDEHSLHFGAFNPGGNMVGFARLILASCSRFPVEEKSPHLNLGLGENVKRENCAEISRFMITKKHKNASHNQIVNAMLTQGRELSFSERVNPVTFGLGRTMYQECLQRGIEYCFAFMEKTCWALMKIYGFNFEPVGPEVDFYGAVRPYVIRVRDQGSRFVEKKS